MATFLGGIGALKANEYRKYAGLIMNKIQEKYNVSTSSTSTGQTIWVKPSDYEKLKKHFDLVKIGGQYVIMVNKKLIKSIGLGAVAPYKSKYRILTKDRRIKNAGTGKDSWFTLDEARKIVNTQKGEKIYEWNMYTMEPMFEVL